MSVRGKIMAAAAVVTLVGGVSAAGTLQARAATPSCYQNCIDLFSQKFGSHAAPLFVIDVQRGLLGQPVTLFVASNGNAGEDFHIFAQGRVSNFAALGLVSPALALHYGGTCALVNASTHRCVRHFPNDWAYEIEYVPKGVPSGLCLGVAKTAADGTKVVLQRCGFSTRTTWVVDANSPLGNASVPLINGSDTNWLDPFVLNYPGRAVPMQNPHALTTWQLQRYPGFGGGVYNNQLWSANFGSL
jgi:hypothetical protein